MLKHYIQYTYRGSFFSETGAETEVKTRGGAKAILIMPFPEHAYSYVFFDREVVNLDGETLIGKPKNFSPRYIKGQIYDIDRVCREVPNSGILQSNMKSNGWNKVIKCLQGFIPMEEGDIVL